MNYFKARQRKDGKWDYTCKMSDSYIFPVGYCCEYIEPREEDFFFIESNKPYLYKDKHHTEGHGTPEEACECYKEYLLDNQLRLNLNDEGTQHPCKVCLGWTNLYAEVDLNRFDLCEKHNNLEEVEKLFKAPYESWES